MDDNLQSFGWSLWCERHLTFLLMCILCPINNSCVRQHCLNMLTKNIEIVEEMYFDAMTFSDGEKLLLLI